MPIEDYSNSMLPHEPVTPPVFTWRKANTEFVGRWRGLIVVMVLSLAAGTGLQQVEWSGSRELHSVMESVATMLALIVGTLSLVRFYANGSAIHICVGAGFVGTGLLDG